MTAEQMLRDWRKHGRSLIALLAERPSGVREPRLIVRWATVTTTITAASGLQKGKGTVSILCDDGTKTGKDKVIQTGVTVWNGYQTQITPASSSGAVRRVAIATVDGLLQVIGSDCPL